MAWTWQKFIEEIPPTWSRVFNADLKPYMDVNKARADAKSAGYCYFAMAHWVHGVEPIGEKQAPMFIIRTADIR